MTGTQNRPAHDATLSAPKRPASAKEFTRRTPQFPEAKPALVGIEGASAPAPVLPPAATPEVAPLIIPDIDRLPESTISAPHVPLDTPASIPAADPVEAATPGLAGPAPDAWTAFAQSQAALARGLEALSIEMTGFARSGFSAAADTATAMLRVTTLGDALALNAGYARHSFDALIGSSAKLSEIGVKLATEASRPLLSRFGEGWKSGSVGV